MWAHEADVYLIITLIVMMPLSGCLDNANSGEDGIMESKVKLVLNPADKMESMVQMVAGIDGVDGENGIDGQDGIDGLNSLIELVNETAGNKNMEEYA